MRHKKKYNHLSRPAAQRKALLASLAKSLILHKRINTTVAKAKALRKFIEPILTKSKDDSTHSRRAVFSYFQDKVPVKELFNNIAPKILERPGGYTRIIRLGNRLGDNAEMCMIELVDYNELLQKEAKPGRVKTRRGGSKANAETTKSPQAVLIEEKETLESTKVSEEMTTHTATVATDSQEEAMHKPDQQAATQATENSASKEDVGTSGLDNVEKMN